MARLTITLSDERHLALREAAPKRRKTIGQLIEESREFYGIKTMCSAEQLLTNARARISERSRRHAHGGGRTRAARRK